MMSLIDFIKEARERGRLFLLERKTNKPIDHKKQAEALAITDKYVNAENPDKELEKQINDIAKDNGPTIYAFVTNKVNNAVKIGFTDQNPLKRLDQWREIYGKEKEDLITIGIWPCSVTNKSGEKVYFWDFAVHKKARERGYMQIKKQDFHKYVNGELMDIHFSREFFDKFNKVIKKADSEEFEELSNEILLEIINGMKKEVEEGKNDFVLYKFDKKGKTTQEKDSRLFQAHQTYSNTGLQQEAIDNALKAINAGKKNLLMAAVMRFGKTHATYEIINDSDVKTAIVVSAKADVRQAWREDINHKNFYKKFVFIEVKDKYHWYITQYDSNHECLVSDTYNAQDASYVKKLIESKKTVIFFFTLQDLAGSVDISKAKHEFLGNLDLDMLVVDETHYGSHSNKHGQVTGFKRGYDNIEDEAIDTEEERKEHEKFEEMEKKLNLKPKVRLQVSGTPYYILASNEMLDDDAEIISKVSYTDMLEAKEKWEKDNKDKNAWESPYYGVPTLHKVGLSLNKKCRKAIENVGATTSMTELFRIKGKKFIYEEAINELMLAVFGNGNPDRESILNGKIFHNKNICKHTIVVLPTIDACDLMKGLMKKLGIRRDIISVTSKKQADVDSIEALNNRLAKNDDKNVKSIILTVYKYLTGVSMPVVDSMVFLRNSSSPQEYDQAIFRLCTRNVKKVEKIPSKDKNEETDEKREPKFVNLKDNVYLIDFNIANMFKMVLNSARMKAAANDKHSMKDVKAIIDKESKLMPIYCDQDASGQITGQMREMDVKDLMKVYTKYNNEKSINDYVDEEIDLFANLFVNDKDVRSIINGMSYLDKGKGAGGAVLSDEEGEDEIELKKDGPVLIDLKDKIKNGGPDGLKKEKRNPEAEEARKKFQVLAKWLLAFNMCQDEPYCSVEDIVNIGKGDGEEAKRLRKELKTCGIQYKDLKELYKKLPGNAKEAFNNLLCNVSMLSQDDTKKDIEKFQTNVTSLGRFGANEVQTPPKVVNMMLDKLKKEDFEKAKTILLVNEKHGEFVQGIYKKFGQKIAEKCRIVPSSEFGEYLIRRRLKLLNIDPEKTILKIEDVNKNGKYELKEDFLNMKNDNILKLNSGSKFDICLMNPPYDGNLHLKFIEKIINVANDIVNISPSGFFRNMGIYKTKYKIADNIIKHLVDYEIIDHRTSNDYFSTNNGIMSELHIGHYKSIYNDGKPEFDLKLYEIYKKIQTSSKNLRNKFIHRDKLSEHGVKIFRYHYNPDVPYYENIICYKGKAAEGINFNNEKEKNNFIESLKLWPYEFCAKMNDLNPAHLPWLGDYSKKWTNEELYKLFNLTKEEINIVKKLLKKSK